MKASVQGPAGDWITNRADGSYRLAPKNPHPAQIEDVAAALALQWDLTAEPWPTSVPLRVRVALHTGEAELDPNGDEYAVSHTKNRVSRIQPPCRLSSSPTRLRR